MRIYYGSNTIVKSPDLRAIGHHKDFGFGFYCTALEHQARRWALTRHGGHVVNVYDLLGYDGCALRMFQEMTEEWLDFIVDCRRGVVHAYDIVEGPMADDQIWNYIEDFMAGLISRAAFWELVKFRYPTHQIAFCSPKALRCITYIDSYTL